MKFKIIILVSLLVFMLSSCNLKPVNVGIPTNIEINELSLQKIKLKLKLPIENPNNTAFSVNDADISFFVNDINLGKISKLEKFKINANSNNEYPISVEIIPESSIANIFSVIGELRKDAPNIEIKGYLKVSKLGIPMKIQLSHKQLIPKN